MLRGYVLPLPPPPLPLPPPPPPIRHPPTLFPLRKQDLFANE